MSVFECVCTYILCVFGTTACIRTCVCDVVRVVQVCVVQVCVVQVCVVLVC